MYDKVISTRMGQRFHPNLTIRGQKIATAVLLIIQHSDGSVVYGAGILYPDTHHLYFTELKTTEPYKLCRIVYAASKMHLLCDDALKTMCMIADESVSLDDPRFNDIGDILYGYTAEDLRKEILAQKIPEDDIRKIVKRFRVWNLEISDPFAKKVTAKETGHASGIFPMMHQMGMQSLSASA